MSLSEKSIRTENFEHKAPFTHESYHIQKYLGPFLPLGQWCIHPDLTFSR